MCVRHADAHGFTVCVTSQDDFDAVRRVLGALGLPVAEVDRPGGARHFGALGV